MVLEATMIVVDNSEHSRNGDYVPSRWEAQVDAVHLIFSAKTGANPESSVGLMSMGGSTPEILTTLTTDMGKIINGLHRTKIRGTSHFCTGINVAALALKHRQNNSQRQRIIVFACSPIGEDEKSIVKLAKRMKKIGISIDIVAFGELGNNNLKKLQSFSENCQNPEGSYLAVINPSSSLLSDSIITTPILSADNVDTGTGGDGGTAGEAGNQFDIGVDASADPDLALALRMSLEEEKARQDRETKAVQDKSELDQIVEHEEEERVTTEGDESNQVGGDGQDDNQDGNDKMDID